MYVKTIATIGPASESSEIVEGLIDAGMNIARLNFSHARPEEVLARNERIRTISKLKHAHVQILQDLCGRRIRIGELSGGSRELSDGEELTFYTLGAPDPKSHEIPIKDEYLHNDIKPGHTLLIESGRFSADVTAVDIANQRISAVLQKGGILLSNKGVNVPYVALTSPALTEKDKVDVALGKKLHFEYVAMSFVQTAHDIATLRAILHPNQRIIAKVEDPVGVKNIDEIISASDGIMVARGDLGVELPLEEIPIIQKEIVAKCKFAGKPSIVATQMLLSMVSNPTPTRAEVSDVANAVMDGTDAVMLSDETAVGDYPIESLTTLVRIARRTEEFLYARENKLF